MFFSETSLTRELLEEDNSDTEVKQRPESLDYNFVITVDTDSIEELDDMAKEQTGHGLLGPEPETGVEEAFGNPEDPVECAHLNAYRVKMLKMMGDKKKQYRQDKRINNHAMYHGAKYSEPEGFDLEITR